jgi:D-glucuronyl C5-epimerase-like protein
MLKVIFVIVAVVLLNPMPSTTASSIPLEAQRLNDRIIIEIAREVMAARHSPPTQQQLDTTSLEVKVWLSSVGGENFYKNYLDRFGYPAKERIVTAALIDLTNEQLGLYYVHGVPISADAMTKAWCVASASATLKAFCALGSRDATALFNDHDALGRFKMLARWFLDNQKDGKWEWDSDVPLRNIKAPWISGLTQSLGISILLREYQLENNQAYLDAAGKALAWMGKSVQEGGIASRQANGVWYEEYPDAEHPSHVLNGHMWALFGIWDFYRVTRDPVAKQMFDDGISVLQAEIGRYDVKDWSVYAQTNRVDLVVGQYQQFIVEQLRVLYAITAIGIFRETADRWEDAMRRDALFVHIAADDFLKANPRPTN